MTFCFSRNRDIEESIGILYGSLACSLLHAGILHGADADHRPRVLETEIQELGECFSEILVEHLLVVGVEGGVFPGGGEVKMNGQRQRSNALPACEPCLSPSYSLEGRVGNQGQIGWQHHEFVILVLEPWMEPTDHCDNKNNQVHLFWGRPTTYLELQRPVSVLARFRPL